ncbi:MAG: DegT/DnrJ/EryC1/StrS family aminotransferase [Oscillospiraceae bacterium]
MKILPNNLKRQYELNAAEYEAKAIEILRKGWYILGDEVSCFENEFSSYIGARHCVGLASGLDALWISFRLLDIGEGDEVIVCSNAYIACAMGISMNGATPVFVEPDEYDNIDSSKIAAALTDKTKAILAVHLFGQSCDMTKICGVAKEHGLRVVEDCAQSHKTMWDGKAAGTFGDIGCFSFYPTKGCGAFGDAGAIVTDSDELADKFRVFRNYGSRVRYQNEVVGTNSRLDELQAGLLRVKLKYLDDFNEERSRIAARYLSEVKNENFTMPKIRPGSSMTWHQFVIHCERRDELISFLNGFEIGTIVHYPIPPHLSEAYAYLGLKKGSFPIAEHNANTVLSLPMYNGMTKEEQSFVIEKLNAFGR